MCLAAPAAVPGVLTRKAGEGQASVLSLCDMGEALATASATRHLLWAPSLSPSGQACREQAPSAAPDTFSLGGGQSSSPLSNQQLSLLPRFQPSQHILISLK